MFVSIFVIVYIFLIIESKPVFLQKIYVNKIMFQYFQNISKGLDHVEGQFQDRIDVQKLTTAQSGLKVGKLYEVVQLNQESVECHRQMWEKAFRLNGKNDPKTKELAAKRDEWLEILRESQTEHWNANCDFNEQQQMLFQYQHELKQHQSGRWREFISHVWSDIRSKIYI